MLFLANFYPPVTLCHTSQDPLKSTSHISDPTFLVGLVQNPDKNPLYKFSRGFCQGVFSLEGFVRSGFVRSNYLLCYMDVCIALLAEGYSEASVRIHLLQQKVKHHLNFQVSYVGL